MRKGHDERRPVDVADGTCRARRDRDGHLVDNIERFELGLERLAETRAHARAALGGRCWDRRVADRARRLPAELELERARRARARKRLGLVGHRRRVRQASILPLRARAQRAVVPRVPFVTDASEDAVGVPQVVRRGHVQIGVVVGARGLPQGEAAPVPVAVRRAAHDLASHAFEPVVALARALDPAAISHGRALGGGQRAVRRVCRRRRLEPRHAPRACELAAGLFRVW